jgi:hypothetical protein
MPRNRVGKFSLPPDLHPTQDLSPGGPPTKSLSPWARFGPPFPPGGRRPGRVALPHPAKDLSPCAGSPSLQGGRRPGGDLPHPTQDLSPCGPVPLWASPAVGAPGGASLPNPTKDLSPYGAPTKSLSPWARFGPPLPPAAGGLGGSPYRTQPKTCPPVRVPPSPSPPTVGDSGIQPKDLSPCGGLPGGRRHGWGLPPESDERPVPPWGPRESDPGLRPKACPPGRGSVHASPRRQAAWEGSPYPTQLKTCPPVEGSTVGDSGIQPKDLSPCGGLPGKASGEGCPAPVLEDRSGFLPVNVKLDHWANQRM